MGSVQIAISVQTCLTNDNHMFVLLAHRAGALGTPAAGFSVFGSWADLAALPLHIGPPV